jgi:hypothetical protein
MAWIAEQLLKVIGSHAPDECITGEKLIELTKLKDRQVENATRKLHKHGLITLTAPGCYRLTSAGKETLATENVQLRSGPRGSYQKVRIHKNSLRLRVWRAIRIRKKFSIPEIEPLVAQGDEKNVRSNIGKYLKVLEDAGYLVKMKKREAGSAPTSNGFVRWWLPDDKNTGPLAPIWRIEKGTVFDPNTGKEVSLCGENS